MELFITKSHLIKLQQDDDKNQEQQNNEDNDQEEDPFEGLPEPEHETDWED